MRFSVFFTFSPPLPFLQREDRRGSDAADDESSLWTVSFPAECVQWARARSWNLANETHPPRASRHSTGWKEGSGGDDWLTEPSPGCCQSKLQIKLAVLIAGIAHHEEAKWSEMYTLTFDLRDFLPKSFYCMYLMQLQMETDEQDEEIRIISFSLKFSNMAIFLAHLSK